MKCQSCEEVISSKFKHAIENNECPYCGQNITDEALNELFKDLFGLISKFEDYKEELQEWMRENLNMVPISSISQKRNRIEEDDEDEEVVVDDDGNVSSVKRNVKANVQSALRKEGVDPSAQSRYRDLANQIKQSNVQGHSVSESEDLDETDGELDDEDKMAIEAERANRQMINQPRQRNVGVTEAEYKAKLQSARQNAIAKFRG